MGYVNVSKGLKSPLLYQLSYAPGMKPTKLRTP